jgi:hypothetical protein
MHAVFIAAAHRRALSRPHLGVADLTAFLSDTNEISGSQRGSQRGQTPGDTGRRLATTDTVRWHFRRRGRRPATVRARLTSEGSLVLSQLRPPDFPGGRVYESSSQRAKNGDPRRAGRAAVHAKPADHPSLPGAGHQAHRSPGLVGRNVAALVKAPAGRGRPSVQEPDPGAGSGAAASRCGVPPVRLRRALGDDWAEDRGVPGAQAKGS